MRFILFLMFFTTTASPGPKVESKATWTLQSTSQMEFSSDPACKAVSAQLMAEVLPVDNLTVRAYCICEPKAGETCPSDTIAAAQSRLAAVRARHPAASVVALPKPDLGR